MKMMKKGKNKNADTTTTMDIQAYNGKAIVAKTNNKESKNEHCPNERPKLDDGFFEIEDVRQKRVRKGEVQYLIKWRGWPETENTWEPLWNLQSCTVLIDAFEQSLLSSKQRKRRGAHFNTQLHSNKKQQLSSATVAQRKRGQTSASANESSIMDNAAPLLAGLALAGPGNGGIGSSEMINTGHDGRKEENGHKQNGNENLTNKNGIAEANSAKPAASARSKGSGRRKPKSVQRFKKDSASNEPDVDLNAVGTQTQRGPGSVLPSRRTGDRRNVLTILQIIRPISFTASVMNRDQDVDVRFLARRSDGAEIMVTNKYLKDHNPLMLIDFYERHLKYSPSIPLP